MRRFSLGALLLIASACATTEETPSRPESPPSTTGGTRLKTETRHVDEPSEDTRSSEDPPHSPMPVQLRCGDNVHLSRRGCPYEVSDAACSLPVAEVDALRSWIDAKSPYDEPPCEFGTAASLRRAEHELHPRATHFVRYTDETILDDPDDDWSSGVMQTRFLLLALQPGHEPEYLGEHVVESHFDQ